MAAEALLMLFLEPDLGCDRHNTRSSCLRLASPYDPTQSACSWDISVAVPCKESEPDPDATYTPTFRTTFDLECRQNGIYKMITASYFSITTLSTVGYGDLFPISISEKIVGMIIMLIGVAFFSFIMSSFIDIISAFNQNLGNEEQAAGATAASSVRSCDGSIVEIAMKPPKP